MSSNLYDPGQWTFPVAGRTGWSDRTEGPWWTRGARFVVPYCLLTTQIKREQFVTVDSSPNASSATAAPKQLGGEPAALPPCRTTPNFPCCRAAVTRRHGHAGCW